MIILSNLVNPVKGFLGQKATYEDLKTEPNLRVDAAIVCRIAGAKATKSTCR